MSASAERLLPGLERPATEAWLAARLGGRAPFRFAPLGRGKSNLTYRVDDAAGRSWVLRRPPLGPLLPSAHDVAREYDVLRALAATGVPVPRVDALLREPAICAAPLVVMERVPGVVLDTPDAVADVSDPDSLGASLARALAAIHAVDLGAVGLADLASRRPYAERQLRRWLRQWEASRSRENPLVERLAERLRRSAPAQHEVTLVHGDYHLLNVVVGSEDGTVRAVLDWELCTLGDPLADLGGLLAYWPEETGEPISALTGVTLAPGFPRREELVAAYAAASGREVEAVLYWQTLACWKIAIIAEGVRRRGGESAAAASITVDAIDALLEQARETAAAARIW